MTRIETFTDAAFAFALTLLVVSLNPPSSFVALRTALQDVPAFLLSATLLMVFWWGHHEWSRRFGLDDGPAFLLSCALVFTILVYVYPLRFMLGLMMSWIGGMTGWPLGQQSVGLAELADVNRIFVIYGIGFVAMCMTLVLLNLHAWRKREELKLDPVEQHLTRSEIGAWLILSVVGVISITFAITLPSSWAVVPGSVYMLLPIVMPVYGIVTGRRHAVLLAERRKVQSVIPSLPAVTEGLPVTLASSASLPPFP